MYTGKLGPLALAQWEVPPHSQVCGTYSAGRETAAPAGRALDPSNGARLWGERNPQVGPLGVDEMISGSSLSRMRFLFSSIHSYGQTVLDSST